MADSSKTGSLEFGRLLVRARERLGMSRRELADATELSYPYISQLETGYRQPSPAAIQRLADVLQLSLDDLFDAMATARPSRQSAPPPAPAASGGGGWVANQSFLRAGRARPDAPAALAHHAALGAAPLTDSAPRGITDVVDDATALLSGLPVDERLAALSRIQERVVESVITDRDRDRRR